MREKEALHQRTEENGTKHLLNEEQQFKLKHTEVKTAVLLGGSFRLGSRIAVRELDSVSRRVITCVLQNARKEFLGSDEVIKFHSAFQKYWLEHSMVQSLGMTGASGFRMWDSSRAVLPSAGPWQGQWGRHHVLRDRHRPRG